MKALERATFKYRGRQWSLFKYHPGGTWHLRAGVNGFRLHQSLQTDVAKQAAAASRPLIDAAIGRRVELLAAAKLRHEQPATLGEIAKCYHLAQLIGANAVRDNINALARIVGGHWKSKPANVLTADLVGTALRTIDLEPTTLNSLVRRARSVFSPAAMELYRTKGLRIPELEGFKKRPLLKVMKDFSFRPIAPDVLEAIKASSADQRPEIRQIFILAFYLGMRAGEIAAARREWIEHDGMRIIRRPDFKPKGIEGTVPIAPEIRAEILALSGPEWLVNARTPTERHDLIYRDAVRWLRYFLPDRNKALHELRKQAGSRVVTAQGMDAARRFLRHSSVAVTERHYGTYLRPIEALT